MSLMRNIIEYWKENKYDAIGFYPAVSENTPTSIGGR